MSAPRLSWALKMRWNKTQVNSGTYCKALAQLKRCTIQSP